MASEIFLKLQNIEGEVTDAQHQKEIAILSFSGGVNHAVTPVNTGGSAPDGVASFTDMSFTKTVDSASPALFKAACLGKPIGEAVLSVNRADGNDSKIGYLKYTLTDAAITNYAAGATLGGGQPTESFALNFKTIRIEYTPTERPGGGGLGAKMAGWNVATGKAL
jgi:type VI secretion system secreted protein Hcp